MAKHEANGAMYAALDAACFPLTKEMFDASMKSAAGAVKVYKAVAEQERALDLERALSLLREVGSKLGPEGFTLAMRQALDAALSLSDDELGCVLDEVRARLAPARALRARLGDAQRRLRHRLALGSRLAVREGQCLPLRQRQRHHGSRQRQRERLLRRHGEPPRQRQRRELHRGL
jgi:hypothetical protein